MAPRLELHTLLETMAPHVYFQPPSTITMSYPCIVYKRDYKDTKFADGSPYMHRKRYQVTIIDRNPDSTIPDLVAELPMCVFDRHFTLGDLNHDTYRLYF